MSTVSFRPRFAVHYYTDAQVARLTELGDAYRSVSAGRMRRAQRETFLREINHEREKIEHVQFVALCKAFLIWCYDAGLADGSWYVISGSEDYSALVMRLSRRNQRKRYDTESENFGFTLALMRRRLMRRHGIPPDNIRIIDPDRFRELALGLLVREHAAFEVRLREDATVWRIPEIPQAWRDDPDRFERESEELDII